MEEVTSQIPDINLASNSFLTNIIARVPLPGGLVFSLSYLQAGAMVILIFFLILTLGQLRHRLVNWKMGGIMPGVYIGFALALILEGIFIVSGRTIVTELIGWESAPKPIVNVLDAGRDRLVRVLGVAEEIPSSYAEGGPTIGGIMKEYEDLSESEQESLQSIICRP